jgi:HlyD family secretion protein
MTDKNKKMWIAVGAALILLVVVGYIVKWARRPHGAVRVSGNIEVTDAEVSFKIPGRVRERRVDEGQVVKAGQLVARLDDAELSQETALRRADAQAAQAALNELLAGSRPEEIAQAKAASEQAKARLDELLAGSRPQELAAAEAALRRARAETERAKLDMDRYAGLYKK